MLSHGSTGLSSFLFILFLNYYYSVPWQWFPPVYLPAQLFTLLAHLFWHCFLLVYFSFQLLYCLSLFVLWIFSLLNISFIFLVYDLGSSYYYYSEFFFWQIASPHLVVVLEFFFLFYHLEHISLPPHFVWLSVPFCRLRNVVSLASCICFLVGKVGPGSCAGLLVPPHCLGRAGTYPSGGQGCVKGCV